MEPRLCFQSANQYQLLQSALAHHRHEQETEAGAFLFAEPKEDGELQVVDIVQLNPEDLVEQTAKYLELQAGVLQRMIVRAHRTSTALIEAHSHPFTKGPRVYFSPLDCAGLKEVGPHVSWRLPNRPYVALVFGRDAFDSLYWESGQEAFCGAVDIHVAGSVLRASRETMHMWRLSDGQV